MFKVPDQYRIRYGKLQSDDSYGNNGAFAIAFTNKRRTTSVNMLCIASDGGGWEHVSVSLPKRERCPKWEEMCFVKNMFWNHSDAVIQIHPPADEYVNCHEFTLHLWRKAGTNDFFEAPPSIYVGPK